MRYEINTFNIKVFEERFNVFIITFQERCLMMAKCSGGEVSRFKIVSCIFRGSQIYVLYLMMNE